MAHAVSVSMIIASHDGTVHRMDLAVSDPNLDQSRHIAAAAAAVAAQQQQWAIDAMPARSAATPGEQTCTARFRVRQPRITVIAFTQISCALARPTDVRLLYI